LKNFFLRARLATARLTRAMISLHLASTWVSFSIGTPGQKPAPAFFRFTEATS
jgi:hypothetical protein